MSASGGLWAGGPVLKNPATQRAVVESKLAQYDDVDDYEDFLVCSLILFADPGRPCALRLFLFGSRGYRSNSSVWQDDPSKDGAATRQWVDTPGKALLYGDRPPLQSALSQKVPLWDREERERQDFLFKVRCPLEESRMPIPRKKKGAECMRKHIYRHTWEMVQQASHKAKAHRDGAKLLQAGGPRLKKKRTIHMISVRQTWPFGVHHVRTDTTRIHVHFEQACFGSSATTR
jgi:hypothetical protein